MHVRVWVLAVGTGAGLMLTGADPRLAQLTANFRALSKGELYILTFLCFADSCVDANSVFEVCMCVLVAAPA